MADAASSWDMVSHKKNFHTGAYGQKGTKTIRWQHIKNPLTIFTQEEVSDLQSHTLHEKDKFKIIVERHAKKTKKNKQRK